MKTTQLLALSLFVSLTLSACGGGGSDSQGGGTPTPVPPNPPAATDLVGTAAATAPRTDDQAKPIDLTAMPAPAADPGNTAPLATSHDAT